ncbi:hypothetical protein [Natranaeroarchaeum sulfidigenes]|uniref:Putative membrane protein n=1 Tax=Natranaeroarchaeum sulfidigenes TaxID=2784880 RepID=A0A897ML38_9EURY|nr:hypothetical protein [Natranaeroarchaeum sulfidigenes]QSG01287.1 putative membrane protein [Natranaeroarchaeum sulfidigenes]
MGDPNKYTEMVLDGREYELIRAQHGLLSRWSIAQKVRGCSYLLFAASATVPIMVFLPPAVSQTYFGGNPAFSPVAFSALLLLSVACLLVSAGGLGVVSAYRSSLGEVSESQAWSLVGFEDIFSGFGFVTGLLGVVATLVLAGLGHAGLGAIESLGASGVHPYHDEFFLSMTVLTAGGVAFCTGTNVFVVGTFLERLE